MGAIKLLGEDTIEILAFPLGGPFEGKDGDGEYFSLKTDLCLDWFPAERPLLYHHGLDDGPGADVIGRIDCKSLRLVDDEGYWVTAQLDKRSRYFKRVKQLIEQGALGGSSGAMPHLVRRAKDGELLRWPWIEQSLTPTPCNPYSAVTYAEAAKHYKSLDIDLPDESALKADHPGDGGSVSPPAAAKEGEAIPADGARSESRGSYEALIAAINHQINDRFRSGGVAGLPQRGYGYTLATFGPIGDGYCVVRCGDYDCDDGSATLYYRVEFGVGEDGIPVMGAASPLEKVYIPATDPAAKSLDLDLAPLALAADTAIRTATVVGRQAEAIARRRREEGRALSETNSARVKALAGELRAQAVALDALLAPVVAGTEGPAAMSQHDTRLQLLRLSLLGA